MKSDEDEEFGFKEFIKIEKPVEKWMVKVDLEMQATLKKMMKEAVFKYASEERINWVLGQLGMVSLAGTQIWWTWRVEDVFNKVRMGDKHAMKVEGAK